MKPRRARATYSSAQLPPRFSAYLVVFAVVLVAPCSAFAETPQAEAAKTAADDRSRQARELFQRGVEASEQARWEEAEAAFSASAEFESSANCLLNLAVARFRLKRPLSGLAAIARVEALGSELPVEQANRARAIRARLEEQLATRLVKVSPSHAELSLNGQRLPGKVSPHTLRLDPGTHTLVVSAEGYLPSQREIKIEAGSSGEIELLLVPAPARAAAESQTAQQMRAKTRSPVEFSLKPRDVRTDDRERSVWVSPWLWIGVGVVAASVGVTVFALSQSSDNEPVTASEPIVISL